MTERMLRFVRAVLDEAEMDDPWLIDDWDLSRVYLALDGDNDRTCDIRMWDISDAGIRWTLFRMVWDRDGCGHGEAVCEGHYCWPQENEVTA